jgi:RecA/RadA recombinase
MPEATEAKAAAADPVKGSAASKPKDKAPAAVAAKPKKKEADLNDRIMARIRASAPRKDGAGKVEIARTSKTILSRVKYVITTGIDPFDDLIGAFPVGRITEVYGLESCGKSQLMIRAAVRAQTFNISEVLRDKEGNIKLTPISKKKAYVHVLYVDNEQSIDSDEKIVVDGVQLDVHLARCDTIDQLFKMADISIGEVEAAQKEDEDTLYIVLIVVDTITSTSCQEEMVQVWGKQDYSRLPKQLKEGFRRLTRRINRANVAMVCTNQVGDEMKQQQQKGKKMGGGGLEADKFVTSGGRALKFFASHRVFMRQLREYKTNPKSKFPNGILIGFRSMKNRIKKPYREGRLVLLFGDENGEGGGFSNEFSILETLLYFRYCEIGEGEKKEIKFKFAKFGIKPTTFDSAETSTTLDEDDSKPAEEVSSRRGKKDPSIGIRAEWPAFYAAHKADIDALYQAAIHQAFALEHVPSEDDEEAVDDEEIEEDEV